VPPAERDVVAASIAATARAGTQPYEWALLRVVPRVERGECVNVGVVVYAKRPAFLGARVTDDLSRALALDPDLDVDGVARHLRAVVALCEGDPSSGPNGGRDPGERFRWLVAPRSTVVQTSAVHTGITAAPAAELDALFARLVAPPEG
jgi:hypothetical protein